MAMPWLRLWTEIRWDPKIQVLSFEFQRHYIMILCLKREGILDCGYPDEIYLDNVVGTALCIDDHTTDDLKNHLLHAGLIDRGWQPGNWEARQFEPRPEGSSAERVRRFRLKQRNACNGDGNGHVTERVTENALQSNGNVTRKSSVSVSKDKSNGKSNVTETLRNAPQRSESDSDTEKRESKRLSLLDENWEPDSEGKRICRERGFDPETVLRKFHAHHKSKATTSANWASEWDLWMQRERSAFGQDESLLSRKTPAQIEDDRKLAARAKATLRRYEA